MNQAEIYRSNSYGPAKLAYDLIKKNFKTIEVHFEPLGHSEWETYGPWSVKVIGVKDREAKAFRKLLHNKSNLLRGEDNEEKS